MVNNVLVIISARLLSCCAVYKRLLSQFLFIFFFLGVQKQVLSGYTKKQMI